jgi:two-component system sensor histidine kinase UhpB
MPSFRICRSQEVRLHDENAIQLEKAGILIENLSVAMHKPRVLIVEDERIIAEDIGRMVNSQGFAVASLAAGGKEAVAKAKADPPDLILMDIVLQDEINGIDAARQIRSHHDVPIIYITAYSDEAIVEAAKTTEPFGYLLKPINEKELHIAIELALHKHTGEKRLREKQARLDELIAAASDTFYLLDAGLVIQDISVGGAKPWGLGKDKLIGKKMTDLVPQEKRGKFERACRRVLRTGEPFTAEAVRAPSSEGEKFVDFRVLKISDGLGFILTDVTERTRLAQSLQEIDKRYRLLVNRIHEGVVIQDENGRVDFVNERFRRMLGYSPNELLGAPLEQFLETSSLAKYRKQMAKLKTGSKQPYEVILIRKNGTPIHVHVTPEPVFDDCGSFRGMIVVIMDLTDRLRFEEELTRSREELRSLSRHLQSVREEESKRIAREIHDEMGQALTALKMDLAWISRRFTEGTQDKDHLLEKMRSMSELLDKTIQLVQKISAELRPGLLDDLGLIPAIEWQVQEFQNRTKIRCRTDIANHEIELTPDQATTIFRVFQESLTNVARHAEAKKVLVNLTEREGILKLIVSDDGKGISENRVYSPDSLGFLGMRERLRPFRGKLEVHGAPDQGTTIEITLPLKTS